MAWLTPEELKAFKSVGRGVLISSEALIYGAENVEIGDNVRIDAQTVILAANGFLSIGSHIHIASRVLIQCGGGVLIQDFVAISMGTVILSASDDASGEFLVGPNHPKDLIRVRRDRVTIESYAFIGVNCLIMPGTQIGQGAVLGFASVARFKAVLHVWSIYGGNPAVFLKERRQDMVRKSIEADARFNASTPQKRPI